MTTLSAIHNTTQDGHVRRANALDILPPNRSFSDSPVQVTTTNTIAQLLPSSAPANPTSSATSLLAPVSALSLLLFVSLRCGSFSLCKSTEAMAHAESYTDSWTINAVAQDDFSDVPIPDAPPQAAHTPHTGVEKSVSGAMLDQRREETRARSSEG